MKLDHISTRELLETLKRRGQGVTKDEHLAADAAHLLNCLDADVLDYPYAEVKRS